MFDEMDEYLKECEELERILWEDNILIDKKTVKKFVNSFRNVEVPELPF